MTRHEKISGLFVKLFILLVLPCVVTSLTAQKLPRGFSSTWVSPRVKNGPLSPATHATIGRYRRGLSDQDFGNRATDTASSTQSSPETPPDPAGTTTTSALPTTPATTSTGTTTTTSAGTTTTPAGTTTTTSAGTTTISAATTASTSTVDTNTTATSQTTTTTSSATRKGSVPFMTIVSLLALILLSKLSSA